MLIGADGVACLVEQRGIDSKQADRVQQDGEPRDVAHLLVLGGAALDARVRLEPPALGEGMTREGIERDLGHHRIRNEEELQQVGRDRLEQR